jgi:hypothetical protein
MKKARVSYRSERHGLLGPSRPLEISIQNATRKGNIEAIKQAIADGENLNAKGHRGDSHLYSLRLWKIAAKSLNCYLQRCECGCEASMVVA